MKGDARFLAGGQSLVQALRLRLASAERLVDLGAIAELKGIQADAHWGTVQVQAVIASGQLSDVTFLVYPNHRSLSMQINQQAMPRLIQEAMGQTELRHGREGLDGERARRAEPARLSVGRIAGLHAPENRAARQIGQRCP